jgi:glutathione S-transferase
VTSAPRITVWHIPVCPFSQRLKIQLALKDQLDAVSFEVVDITRPRPGWLLAKAGGRTALPILEDEHGRVLEESLVLLRYLEQRFGPPIARDDAYETGVENMLIGLEGPFTAAGYRFVMNQDRARRDQLERQMLDRYAELDAFLARHAPEGPFLFDRFGLAEAVYTPFFQRFWFLEYYEGFELPDEPRFARVRAWREACLAHPAAQQVSREEIVKLYYDYATNAGNGALPPGRTRSSFAFEPHWRDRPWPPADKYNVHATDADLGLL